MIAPHMQAAFLKAAIDQQRELFDFLGRRCDEDMKLAARLGSAASASDVYSACIGFYQDAATQYAAEAGKVAEIGSQGTIGIVHDIQQQQGEALAAVREAADAARDKSAAAVARTAAAMRDSAKAGEPAAA